MKPNPKANIRFLILAWIIPFIFSMYMYYGFATTYTEVFSEVSFRQQYSSGIYRYRVLGSFIQLQIFKEINKTGFSFPAPQSIKYLDPNFSPDFYFSYFVNNTVFLCLTCSILFLILNHIPSQGYLYNCDLVLILLCLLICLTQYVVVPYDSLSYFLLFLAIYLILLPWTRLRSIVLGVIVVFSTLTRETAILIPAFYLAIYSDQILDVRHLNRYQMTFLLTTIIFLVTYFTLRIYFGFSSAFFQKLELFANFSNPLRFIGILLFLVLLLILLFDGHNQNIIIRFLLTSSPYVIGIMLFGTTWEARLFLPIILILVVIKAIPLNPNVIPKEPFAGLNVMS